MDRCYYFTLLHIDIRRYIMYQLSINWKSNKIKPDDTHKNMVMMMVIIIYLFFYTERVEMN